MFEYLALVHFISDSVLFSVLQESSFKMQRG